MKCMNCGNDLFPEQFRCDKCGAIVELELKKGKGKEEPKKDVALKDLKDK